MLTTKEKESILALTKILSVYKDDSSKSNVIRSYLNTKIFNILKRGHSST